MGKHYAQAEKVYCLWQYLNLKSCGKQLNIKEFCGQVCAVDASCWIHKGLSISFSQTGNRERFLNVFKDHLKVLQDCGVILYVVFDGQKLAAKAHEEKRRQNERERLTKRATQASGDLSNRLLGQAASISFEDTTECIKLCVSQGIRYIVSPYESDAQIAFLLRKGLADFAITEDSDLLAYGCEKVVAKFRLNGSGEYFSLSDVLDKLKVSGEQFLDCCITAGCDYLQNVRGIGIHKSFKMHMDATVDVFSELEAKGAPKEYRENFKKAKAVFHHQTVFDPLLLRTTPTNEWPSPPSQELQQYCGIIYSNLDDAFANELAVGNINIKTGTKTNSFSLFTKPSTPDNHQPQNKNNCRNQDGLRNADLPNAEFVLKIVKISDAWLSWTIPSFPVMTLDFNQVTFQFDGKEFVGLIIRGQTVCIGRMKCKTHCNINIDGKSFIVIWEPKHIDPKSDVISESYSDSESENILQQSNAFHSLPFKVLGTCHCTSRQKALEEAYECLHEYNRPVFAKLQEEPENPYDENAIAVYIDSSELFVKVGYIAKELTSYVRPCLGDPNFKVSVKNIRFQTTFLMVGFYLSIILTKKGTWPDQVVKASKSVK